MKKQSGLLRSNYGIPGLLIAMIVSITFAPKATAQFIPDRGTPETLVGEVFKGPGIRIRNVKYSGAQDAIGSFRNNGPQPGFKSGVILSTGIAAQAAGPNENPKTSTANGGVGDRKLDAISKTRTFDAASLEFEFMADKDSISLRFIFASEEYAEHVGSTFTDPIMIVITGPGLGNGRHLALLPGTTNIPVNINSINISENKRWYVDNNPFTLAGKPNPNRKAELDLNVINGFQYDGMTRPIEVGMKVTPKEVYRMRIAIADAGDGNFDSALLLEGGSFRSLEQNRHTMARLAVQEKRIADSLARAESVRDSILEAEGEMGIEIVPESPILDDPAGESPEEVVVVDEEEDEDEGEFEFVDTLLSEPTLPGEIVEEDEDDLDTLESQAEELSPALPKVFRTIIQFEEDGYFVPEDQEDVLREYALILKANPNYALGIFVPAASDEETNALRYDMVRLEIIKSGAKPAQVFRLGFSMNDDIADKVPKHRAELLLKTKD